MPLKEMLENARDKFTGAMGDAERFSIGLSNRAKRLKQAMFPDEIKPGEAARSAMGEAGQEAMQDQIENRSKKRR
jgi:hypothetical protein